MLITSDEMLEAEQELLDTIIENVLTYHSEHYEKDGDIIRVLPTGDEYRISDYYSKNPLSLIPKLVQEDILLLKKIGDQWCYMCGVACMGFTDMGLRGERGFLLSGNAIDKIHAPVPNFK